MRLTSTGGPIVWALGLVALANSQIAAQSPFATNPAAVGGNARTASSVAGQDDTQSQRDDQHDMANSAGLGALQIRGFNDINFQSFQVDPKPNTFKIGQLDLFLSSRMSPEFNVIAELVVEAGDDNAVGLDLERMLLRYSPSDRFSLSAGRYHTAIGYYNTTYHHGNWFQTAIGRPFIFRFEDDGGLLPVHGVGLTAQGQIPSGQAGLKYTAEVSNGRRSGSRVEEAVQNVADENRGKAVNVALFARPAPLPGLQAGVSVYHDRLVPADGSPLGETIVAAHVVYDGPALEQLNEAIFVRHQTESGQAFTTTSFYTQVGVRLRRIRPYVRFEYLHIPERDPYGLFAASAGRSYGPSLGVRLDAATAVALKLQYDRFKGPIRDQINGLTAQLAFTF